MCTVIMIFRRRPSLYDINYKGGSINFCAKADCLLNYLEDIRNTMAPHKRINIPIPIIIIPLTVQPGLLYINEEGGPT